MRTAPTPLLAALAAAGVLLAGCATPTVYQPAATPGAVGFSQVQIEPDRFRVTFKGGNGADAGVVGDYALMRAADLTLQQGYEWFVVTNHYGQVSGQNGPQVSLGGGGADFGRHSAVGIGTGASFDLSGGPQLADTVEIRLGRGPKPEGADVYDARSVSQSLHARLG